MFAQGPCPVGRWTFGPMVRGPERSGPGFHWKDIIFTSLRSTFPSTLTGHKNTHPPPPDVMPTPPCLTIGMELGWFPPEMTLRNEAYNRSVLVSSDQRIHFLRCAEESLWLLCHESHMVYPGEVPPQRIYGAQTHVTLRFSFVSVTRQFPLTLKPGFHQLWDLIPTGVCLPKSCPINCRWRCRTFKTDGRHLSYSCHCDIGWNTNAASQLHLNTHRSFTLFVSWYFISKNSQ